MQPINTKLAPKAIGTYSQAIRSGEIVFLSGQIPLDPETMQICSDDIKLQITQVLENLSAVCEEAGGSLANIAKLNVYLTDLSHFPLINEAMSRYFSEPYPARAAIEVSALPKGAKVEMDGILVLPASA
ncbi:RidA family protein [Legionella pneumophila serogroup 1]|jgi:reactive intermediate/imine deaminase|uniref:Endoribonuclease L-PSP n=1 Tax=Legionella pneumophila TaxID=446 RepID=A0A129BXF0_LEGPN|nr:RidA family protein [Legionella pneumophila]PYD07694.1 RidA family protein [Pseudomonas syringae pv. pisi]ADG25370.1 endoribonuclease L-PSP [Legionella pneumophila 2300/99 Alcoy]AMV14780.1 Enamine/imine deaminase [Legionella pneumophila]ANN92975.1 reactive intermediate/imine deaminase [Legionella pneumophila]MCH9061681.1 RidA family protein [Legionella pneumophila serogroup 1]